MAGIYIHVPFCARKCDYCDFYSVTTAEEKDRFANLIEMELVLRKDYIPEKNIETIYFGGGTPSLLSAEQLSYILWAIRKQYSVAEKAEITLEANPDDLNETYFKQLLSLGINRLSIGVQSFSDNDLQQLGRRHNASQAINAVQIAYELGFENISIDLIYGLPYSSTKIWKENLQKAFELPVKHISCYHLIYEEGTPLFKRMKSGQINPVNEEKSVEQFEILQQLALENGFIQYEISNLAKEGYFSRHNTSYWKQIHYIGVGPSAHSYNGITREWNPKSVKLWSSSIQNGNISAEKEVLTEKDHLNDYLLTSLRTMWGLDTAVIEKKFGVNALEGVKKAAKKYVDLKIMEFNNGIIRILPRHFLTSDGIISDFLVV